MRALPTGWVEVALGEVVLPLETCDPTKEGAVPFRYVDIGSINNKSFSIETPKSLMGRDAPSRARRRIRCGDVLFSTVRTYLKNIALVPKELDGEVTSTGIAVLRPSDAIVSSFLFAMVRSEGFIRPLTLKQDGTLYPAITDGDLLSHKIALPPLTEQIRISSKLDSLNAKSARARTELARIEPLVTHYKQAVLSKAFSGALTRDWRRICGLNFNWEVKTIADVAIIASGQTPKEIESFLDPDGDVSWFKVSSMNESENINGLHSSKFRISVEHAQKLKLKIFPVGSITFPKRGGAIATNKKRKLAIAAAVDLNLMVLTPINIRANFLWWWMQKLDLSTISNGSSVPQINNGDIAPLSIQIPSDDEQDEVIRLIEVAFAKIDRLAAEAKRALNLLDKFDDAILAKAFRGKLVPQDQNDEPSEHLLERIRAERAMTPKEKTKTVRRKATMSTAKDFLNEKLKNWPDEGISFKDLREAYSGSYEELKEAVFILLSGNQAKLQQIFDERKSLMTIKKR